MLFTLITSKMDPASKTMIEYLQESKKFKEIKDFYFTSSMYDNISMLVSKTPLIYADNVDTKVTKPML